MFFNQKKEYDAFYKAIEKLKKNDTEENRVHVFSVLRTMVEKEQWVFSTGDAREGKCKASGIEERGHMYLPVYTCRETVKTKDRCIFETSMSKFIDTLYASRELRGLVINPGSQELYIEKERIIKCLLHEKYPEVQVLGVPPKDWGAGIPQEYKAEDTMSKEALLQFAMQIVYEQEFTGKKWEPVSYCRNSEAVVQFIVKREEQFVFVVVEAYTGSEAPAFEETQRQRLAQLCQKFYAKGMLASVGLYSCDEERAAAGLLLKGDGFFVKYTGLQEIVE